MTDPGIENAAFAEAAREGAEKTRIAATIHEFPARHSQRSAVEFCRRVRAALDRESRLNPNALEGISAAWEGRGL